ncbi:hypothetical protein [Streptomyces sp. NPDC003023]|uniref:hypothetical protein n=1 Tax=Streptomyces sp. NPDC003023 TaxID=3364675 RepID=UPI0036C5B1AC
MSSTVAAHDAPGTVHLATDTGQNFLAVSGTLLLGLLVLSSLCAYLFPAFAARGRFAAPTRAGTLRDVALMCVAAAAAIHLFGVLCYIRLENQWYTCGPQRFGHSSSKDRPDLEYMQESLFPVRSVCRWSDGYTYDFVPAFVNPAIAALLVLAAVAAGVALGHAGTRRGRGTGERGSSAPVPGGRSRP